MSASSIVSVMNSAADGVDDAVKFGDDDERVFLGRRLRRGTRADDREEAAGDNRRAHNLHNGIVMRLGQMSRPVVKRPESRSEWIAAGLAVAVLASAMICFVWLGRYTIAVHRLTRGVGDTEFYSVDGQPWFRLDERRHDVQLDEISGTFGSRSSPSKTDGSTITRELTR